MKSPKMDFVTFCTEVNALSRAATEKILNERPKRLFGASVTVYSTNHLRFYYETGYSPTGAYKRVTSSEFIPCA